MLLCTLSQAEKRTLEALEAFGGGLDAVLIKTESFGDKLDKQREMIKAMESSAGEPKSKRTRFEIIFYSALGRGNFHF